MKAEEIRNHWNVLGNFPPELLGDFAMLEIAAQLAELNQAKPQLRDHYAMAAMQSVLSSDPAILWEDPNGHKKAMKQIFAWADAMIEARKMQ